MRLFLPGVEGNASVKWLRRIELADQPFMTREETSKYTDPLPDGTARMFSLVMDAKSLITEPAFPDTLTGPGLVGDPRHRVDRARQDHARRRQHRWRQDLARRDARRAGAAEVPHALPLPVEWKGGEAVIMSRATDETGYVQPTRVLLKARGPNDRAITSTTSAAGSVAADGTVKFAGMGCDDDGSASCWFSRRFIAAVLHDRLVPWVSNPDRKRFGIGRAATPTRSRRSTST